MSRTTAMEISKLPRHSIPTENQTASFVISNARAWSIVWILTGLTIVSFVNRQVLSVLIVDVQRDLKITDTQFGVLIGPAFIFTYNIVVFPLVFLIDRLNRKWLLFAGIIFWSLMTFSSAFVHRFQDLVVLRSGLAVGEALLGPTAISLIGDLFPRDRRALPTAMFIAGSTAGQTGAAFFGAFALQSANNMKVSLPYLAAEPLTAWRLAMVFVALPGVILGIVYLLTVREPARGGTSINEPEALWEQEKLVDHIRRRGLVYLLVAVVIGLGNMVALSFAVWGPAYLIRAFGKSAVSAGYLVGGLSMAFGTFGCMLLPPLLKWFAPGKNPAVAMIYFAFGALIVAAPAAILGSLASSLPVALTGFAIAITAISSIYSLPSQFVQLNAPSGLRARVIGGIQFVFFMISAGVGPVAIPLLADRFFAGPTSLGRAMALNTIVATMLALSLLWILRAKVLEQSRHSISQKDSG